MFQEELPKERLNTMAIAGTVGMYMSQYNLRKKTRDVMANMMGRSHKDC